MTDEATTTKVAPTLAELEGKVQRLTNQVSIDGKNEIAANDAFGKAVKSGNVDLALDLADKRTAAKATAAKSAGQLKTATNAVTSAKYAVNVDKIADTHNGMRDGKLTVPQAFEQLEKLGVERVCIERSKETGKLILNSAGPTVKRPRGGGGGGGNGRGQSVTVDGKEFASASAALHEFFPDSGPLNRDSILSKLTNAGHEVS